MQMQRRQALKERATLSAQPLSSVLCNCQYSCLLHVILRLG